MSRTLLLLASSTLKSIGFALVVVGGLIAANNVAWADPPPPNDCGTPNDLQRTCPNVPPCPANKVCTYVLTVPPNSPAFSNCFCTVSFPPN